VTIYFHFYIVFLSYLLTLLCFAGLKTTVLQELLGDEALRPILAGRQYVLSQLTLSVVTGMTLNHSRILLGYCLGYGENNEDTRFFLQFLLANGGGAINAAQNVIMSDRGACAGPVDDVIPLALHHYCPKHLERNLLSYKYEKTIIEKFWEARSAKDQARYEAVMMQMESISAKGKLAAEYLRAIPNWQLYVIVTNHAVLYDLKSDNLVEGMFATLKEARCQASPVFASSEIAARALDTIRTAESSTPEAGFLTPRALRLSMQNYEASRRFVAEQVSAAGQYTVRLASCPKSKGKLYNVNVKDKTCSCHGWQQSGGPCCHAWQAISPTQMCIESKYYYEFCFATRLRAMFNGYSAMSLVSMEDVDNLQAVNMYPTITPRTALVALTGQSSKRIRSTGDSKAGGGLSRGAIDRRKKTPCPQCGKALASDNHTHVYSAECVRYANCHESGSLFANKIIDSFYVARAAVVDADIDSESSCA
jgi:hypothetical protein